MRNLVFLNITYSDKGYYSGKNFLPIAAGTDRTDIQVDSTGDNISHLNPHFGELTAVYWAWKNLKNVDVIGTSHYRRYLMTRSFGLVKTHYNITWSNFLTSRYNPSKFDSDLQKYDFVISKKWHFEGLTVKEQFLQHHPFPEDLLLLRSILQEVHPDSVPIYDDFLNGSDTYTCCLFVTTWKKFDKLCNWMFPVLFELERRLDFSKYDSYQQRMAAFLYERLLNVYLTYEKYTLKEYPFYFINNDEKKSICRQNVGAIIWSILSKFRK